MHMQMGLLWKGSRGKWAWVCAQWIVWQLAEETNPKLVRPHKETQYPKKSWHMHRNILINANERMKERHKRIENHNNGRVNTLFDLAIMKTSWCKHNLHNMMKRQPRRSCLVLGPKIKDLWGALAYSALSKSCKSCALLVFPINSDCVVCLVNSPWLAPCNACPLSLCRSVALVTFALCTLIKLTTVSAEMCNKLGQTQKQSNVVISLLGSPLILPRSQSQHQRKNCRRAWAIVRLTHTELHKQSITIVWRLT